MRRESGRPVKSLRRDYSWVLLVASIALYLVVHITAHVMGAEAFE